MWPKRIGKLQRWLTSEEIARQESIGVTAVQLDAIQLVGIPVGALRLLLTFGLGTSDARGQRSPPEDGAN